MNDHVTINQLTDQQRTKGHYTSRSILYSSYSAQSIQTMYAICMKSCIGKPVYNLREIKTSLRICYQRR